MVHGILPRKPIILARRFLYAYGIGNELADSNANLPRLGLAETRIGQWEKSADREVAEMAGRLLKRD